MGINKMAKGIEMSKYLPCKISPEAHMRLKLSSALTGRDMASLASEAVLAYCSQIVSERMKDIDLNALNKMVSKKKKK